VRAVNKTARILSVRQSLAHLGKLNKNSDFERAIQTNSWAMTDETPPLTGELHFDFARSEE
jgi:hypothetical protein